MSEEQLDTVAAGAGYLKIGDFRPPRNAIAVEKKRMHQGAMNSFSLNLEEIKVTLSPTADTEVE